MALKKQERKDRLIEIYNILAKIKDNQIATDARKKVISLLAEDGFFIFENNES